MYFQKKNGEEKFCPIDIKVQDMNNAIFIATFSSKRVQTTSWMDLEFKGYCKENDHDNDDSLECMNEDESTGS